MNPENIIVFLDNIQRTVIATLLSETTDVVVVDRPVILNVSPTPDKKLQVQLYPLFFREFTQTRDDFPKWTYNKNSITVSNVQLESNLLSQYRQMFTVQGVPSTTPVDPSKVIKLFDE